MIIYRIVNNINGKTYVGLTKKALSERIAAHVFNKSHLGNALRKYGLDSFSVSVIDAADTVEVLKEKEIYWIAKLNCKYPHGYNYTDGGDGLVNPPKEVRAKISAASIRNETGKALVLAGEETRFKKGQEAYNKGMKLTEEWIENLRTSHLGHKDSEATKKNKSEALTKAYAEGRRKAWNKGIPNTEEANRKNSESNKGKPAWNKGLTAETDPRIAQASKKIGRPGRKDTEEARANKSLAMKGIKRTEDSGKFDTLGRSIKVKAHHVIEEAE